MRHAPTLDLKPWFLTVDDIASQFVLPLDWAKFFGTDQPVEIDVGCGRGLFLVNASEHRPETNFLGIELDYKEGRRAATRLFKRKQQNARIIGGSVFDVFGKLLKRHTVSALHVYFPDPWWKQKHRRRRVFTDKFVDACSQMLTPGGMLHSWTDVEEYFHGTLELLAAHTQLQGPFEVAEQAPQHELDYRTHFERRMRMHGEPVFRSEFRKPELV